MFLLLRSLKRCRSRKQRRGRRWRKTNTPQWQPCQRPSDHYDIVHSVWMYKNYFTFTLYSGFDDSIMISLTYSLSDNVIKIKEIFSVKFAWCLAYCIYALLKQDHFTICQNQNAQLNLSCLLKILNVSEQPTSLQSLSICHHFFHYYSWSFIIWQICIIYFFMGIWEIVFKLKPLHLDMRMWCICVLLHCARF